VVFHTDQLNIQGHLIVLSGHYYHKSKGIMEYYIYKDQQEGPFSLAQLNSKAITADTPVWHTGLAEWTTAGKLADLSHLIKQIPPPFPAAAVSEYEYQIQMEEFFTEKKKIDWGTIAWIMFSIGSLVFLIWVMNRS
jgi:hypothetical protein